MTGITLITEDVILTVVDLYQLSLVKQSITFQFVFQFVETGIFFNLKKYVMTWAMDAIVLARVLIQVIIAQIPCQKQNAWPFAETDL